jgi:hypothetical protein
VNQPVSRLVTVSNNEYDYLLLIQTSINKLRTASRPAERSWLVGDLKDWQIATQPHQGRLIPPTTVFYEGKHRLSYLLSTEWSLQANKGAGKQYRLYLYYSIDGSAPEEVCEAPSEPIFPVKKGRKSNNVAIKRDDSDDLVKLKKVIEEELSGYNIIPRKSVKQEEVSMKQEKPIKQEKAIHKRVLSLSSAQHPYSTRSRPKLMREKAEEAEEAEEGAEEAEVAEEDLDEIEEEVDRLLEFATEGDSGEEAPETA